MTVTMTKAAKNATLLGKKATRTKGNNHFDDDAFQVAQASEGKINTAQVRILRFLKSCKGKSATRKEVKEAVGHWPGRSGYHIKWVNTLRELAPKFMKIEEHEPKDGEPAKHTYTITALGKATLEKAEKAAKSGPVTKTDKNGDK